MPNPGVVPKNDSPAITVEQYEMSEDNNTEQSWSRTSFQSDEENTVVLHRKKSTASNLTEVLIKRDQHPHRQSSGLSLHEPSNFDQEEELHDVYIEDLFMAGRKRMSQQVHNKRATMGFWKLLWFDLQMWYRRWSVKHQETVFLKSYITNMERNFGSAIGSLFVFLRWVIFLNVFLSVLWVLLVILPAAIMFDYTTIEGNFAFRHLVDGKGMMANSWFFYGFYTSKIGSYNLDLAYLFMMLVTYFGSLFLILASINQNTKTKSTSSIGSRYPFAILLWTSWDHTISSKEAAVNLSKGIASAFKDNLYEAKASLDVKKLSRKEKIKVYLLRLIAWILTIILIGGGCIAIVYLVIYTSFERMVPQGSGQSLDFVSVYGTTVIFSLINGTVPVCIRQLPRIEQYHIGRDELNITLTRIFFLRMANLFALITSLYETITKAVEGCAGTVLGQEMYKLVILDTVIQSTMQLIMSLAKYLWTQKKEEYNISQAVLELIYRQALVWAGTMACPVLPVVGLASNFIFFVVNYTVISVTCKPPLKRWNQSRNTSFFTLVLLGSLAMLIPPASIIIGSSNVIKLGQTNTDGVFCGPFKGDAPVRAYTRFYTDQASWLGAALRTVVSEVVLIPLFLISFTVMIHFYRSFVSEKRNRAVLKAELQQEREENEKLIKKLERMGVAVQRGR